MTFIQKLFTFLLPRAWAESMRAESLAWMLKCPCGFERSIWDSGAIRWKAKGSPKRFFPCVQCKKNTWHIIYKKPNL